MNPRVFREYDIRGVADRDFDDALVRDLGQSIGTMIVRGPGRDRVAAGARPRLALGRDCRITSPRLHAALVEGLVAAGVDVRDVGVVATPVLYFAAHHLEVEGAVIITGSHNPAEDNGFKILAGTTSLHGDAITALRRTIEQREYAVAGAAGAGQRDELDVLPAYLEHAIAALRLGPRRCKVVVDAGNGAGGPAAVALYRRMGFDVVPLYCELDGRFPHHHPDPTVEANLVDLQARVAAEGAELGIALDGDADRIGAIDGQGRILWGDQLLILFGRAILAEHPGARIVGEVKCSQALFDELRRAGGEPEMWKVGHSLIKARMKETGALLAGEMSGHMFFAHRYLGFDDGIYAGARLLELLSHDPRTLAEHYATLPVMVNTPELRVDCSDELKFAVVAAAATWLRYHPQVRSVVEVDGVRAQLADGWGLVRASNTQPALVVRCEAGDAERLAAVRAIIDAAIRHARLHAVPPAPPGGEV